MSLSRKLTYLLAAVAGLAFNPLALTAAHADTTDLQCSNTNLPYKLFVDINMNAKTVTYWMGTDTRNQATTTPATITDNQVTWAQNMGNGVSRFTLDRGTGILNIIDQQGNPGSWSCAKTSKVF